MELSKRTSAVLNNFSKINSNLVINPGNVVKTMSAAKNVLAKATVDEQFPKTLGIYDLSEFMNVVSLVDSPDLVFDEQFMIVGDANGKSRIKYFYSDPEMLTSPHKEITMPGTEVNFTLDKVTLDRILRAALTLECKTITISPVEGNLRFSVVDIENKTSNSFSVDIEGEFDTSVDFSLILNVNNLKSLLNEDYEVGISSKLISHWKSKETPLEYFIALEKSSKYGN